MERWLNYLFWRIFLNIIMKLWLWWIFWMLGDTIMEFRWYCHRNVMNFLKKECRMKIRDLYLWYLYHFHWFFAFYVDCILRDCDYYQVLLLLLYRIHAGWTIFRVWPGCKDLWFVMWTFFKQFQDIFLLFSCCSRKLSVVNNKKIWASITS